jgi:hypothetical protein
VELSSAKRGRGRVLGNPVFAAALALLTAMLFCWPFVRMPPLSLGHAYLHLFGSWAMLILALWRIARQLGRLPRADRRPR